MAREIVAQSVELLLRRVAGRVLPFGREGKLIYLVMRLVEPNVRPVLLASSSVPPASVMPLNGWSETQEIYCKRSIIF